MSSFISDIGIPFELFISFSVLFATLYSMAILVENFMLVCFQKIAKKHKFSEQTTGYLLAIGSSIPEFTTNLIASLKQNKEMLQFGMGAITGSGAYDFTICLAFASFFIVYQQFPYGLELNKRIFFKNSIIYLLTLALLAFFLNDSIINIFEAVTLCLLFPIYVYLNDKFDEAPKNEEEKAFDEDDNRNFLGDTEDELSLSTTSEQSDYTSDNKITISQSNIDIEIGDNQIPKAIGSDQNSKKSYIHIFMSAIKLVSDTLNNILEKSFQIMIPIEKSIPISLIVLAILTIVQTRIVIYCIESISTITGISTSFLGMTIISWGNNIGDTINACVAAKLGRVDLLVAGIIGAQILNLQFCLGFPWLISILYSANLQLFFDDSNTMKYFALTFFVVLFTVITFIVFKMRLNKYSGFVLILIYLSYLIYEFKN